IAPNHLAPLIKETFQLIAQKIYPTEVIRLMMQQKGLTDRRGNAVNRAYFFRIVRNPLYKGVIKSFGVTVNGSFEPIVEADLFDEVQAILNGRKNTVKHYLKENPDFPLRRFIINEDGKLLRGYWAQGKTKKYPYYSFHQAGTTIRKEALESAFLGYLESLSFDSGKLRQLKRYLDSHFTKRINNEEQATVAIQERIKELDKQIDKLIELHSGEKISVSIFTTRIKKIEDERDDLLELQKSKITENVDINELLKNSAKALKQPHVIWQNGNLELKRAWQKFVFPKGLVFDGKNLRTPKICRIFNLKDVFDPQKFSIVTLRDTRKNTLSGTNLPPSDNKVLESKEFAACVMTDLRVLREIKRGNMEDVDKLYEKYLFKV
ncbi:MAG: recombinase family protein, partial [Bacteroidetes bacterium]|nr:recombinase family protein [Bacteroidota bacterium]